MIYLLVALGSAIGGVLRFWMTGVITALAPAGFPWGTLVVNISGSFAIGVFAALTGPASRLEHTADWRAFLMVGICGGYTTFSAFSLQTLDLAQSGQWLGFAGNIAGSVLLCLLGAWLGMHLFSR